MSHNTNSLPAVMEPLNTQAMAQMAPEAYAANSLSHSRCLQAGQKLLDLADSQGMSDDLDKMMATFILKAKATVRKMNDKRSPVTKLFDEIRTAYTSMENDVDPSKNGTIPQQIQARRNAYAAKKLAEQQQRQREQLVAQERKNAIQQYRTQVAAQFQAELAALLRSEVQTLHRTLSETTLENYHRTLGSLEEMNPALPDSWVETVIPDVPQPRLLSRDECLTLQSGVLAEMLPQLRSQYAAEITQVRDDILLRLPSKKVELENIRNSSLEEAQRLRQQMAQAEQRAADAAAAEMQRKEQQAAQQTLAQQQTQQMTSLFDATAPAVAQPASYAPKTQTRKKITLNVPDDVMRILSFWWCNAGSSLPLDELAKTFKKQITFAEKCANDKANPQFITDILYTDDVKAK